jgi:hypothetical protein
MKVKRIRPIIQTKLTHISTVQDNRKFDQERNNEEPRTIDPITLLLSNKTLVSNITHIIGQSLKWLKSFWKLRKQRVLVISKRK